MNDKVLQAVLKLRDEFTKPMKEAKAQVEAFNRATVDSKKKLADFNEGMNTIGKTSVAVGASIVASIGSAFVVSAKNAIEFESAFAGVMKTVNESANTTYDDLSKGLIELSNRMPKTTTELAGIAEVAGQLGIETDNILAFTETMAMLADTTNIAGEEGALQLAKFMNVMGTSQSDVDKLGSSIVNLGNNMATTEADILGMASRLSDLGILADFSETQVLAWASAMSSVGIEAEMGGTAMKKLVTEIEMATLDGGQALNDFAKIAGVSASEYKKAFENDASNATLMFLQGLEKIKQSGGSISQALTDLDIKEVRLRETIIKLASANDMVTEALGLSGDAWNENTALVNEANVRYGTTASQLQIMRNQINNASLDIGNALLPIIRDLVEWVAKVANWFSNLDPVVKEVLIGFGLTALAIGAVLVVGGALLMFVSGCVTAFTTLTAVLAGFGLTMSAVFWPITVVVLALGVIISTIILVKKAWETNWNGIQEKTKSVIDSIVEGWNWLKETMMAPINAVVNIFKKDKTGATDKVDGSHAFGMSRIPRNGYTAQMHEGERILTKQQANNYEKQNASSISINISEMTVREEADINKIANELAKKISQQRLAFAGAY